MSSACAVNNFTGGNKIHLKGFDFFSNITNGMLVTIMFQ